MHPAHDTVTADSRKAQQNIGHRLVNHGRHATHAASLDQHPEAVPSSGLGNPLGRVETRAFAKPRL